VLEHLGHVALAAIAVAALDDLVSLDLAEVRLGVAPIGKSLLKVPNRHPTMVEKRDEWQAVLWAVSEHEG
jgi:hypothetical protein